MIVEHDFITTVGEEKTIQTASQFLDAIGFRITATSRNEINAVRGRKTQSAIKVHKLPQTLAISYDRGKVSINASVAVRGNKDRPSHSKMLLAIAHGLERCIAQDMPAAESAREYLQYQKRIPGVWMFTDVIATVLMVSIFLWIAICIVTAVVS